MTDVLTNERSLRAQPRTFVGAVLVVAFSMAVIATQSVLRLPLESLTSPQDLLSLAIGVLLASGAAVSARKFPSDSGSLLLGATWFLLLTQVNYVLDAGDFDRFDFALSLSWLGPGLLLVRRSPERGTSARTYFSIGVGVQLVEVLRCVLTDAYQPRAMSQPLQWLESVSDVTVRVFYLAGFVELLVAPHVDAQFRPMGGGRWWKPTILRTARPQSLPRATERPDDGLRRPDAASSPRDPLAPEQPMRLSWLSKASLVISGSARDPSEAYAKLRESEPVCWIPRFDAWVVTRHEDVQAMLTDGRLTTDPRAYERYVPPATRGADRWLTALPFRSSRSDPQSVPRRLAMGVLTPRAVERTELRIREVVERFAGPLEGRRDVVDLMDEFTTPVSTIAIGRILGVPPKDADEDRFRLLARNATRSIRPLLTAEKRRKSEVAGVEICEYVLRLVQERRAAPADDMISDLIRASGADTDAGMDAIVKIASALVSAGTGTVGVACARAIRTLLLHPAELATLREDRSLVVNAVDELLRYDSGLALVPRYVAEDFEFRGQPLRKGQLVALSLFAANRDPRVFPDPDRLDLRRDCRQAMSFGHGPHFCTGTSIARIQLRVMLEAALDFLPSHARLLEDRTRWSARGLMGQIKSLPVDFGAG